MSEREKDIIRKLSSTVPKLEEDDQKYVLGVAEGMALMKEKIQEDAQEK